jgi:hypothetical protein
MLFLLGCYHGLNPGMGWLFAVALGFQEHRVTAVLRAIVPLALGHIMSVALVVVIGICAAAQLPHNATRFVAGAVLIAFGAFRLVRARHVRWVGMQVGFWGLTLWGFLMSSAHGAGLMLLPFVIGNRANAAAGTMAMPDVNAFRGSLATGWLMVGVHTLGYVLTVTAVALVVYTTIGVRFLRTAWMNLDLVWAVALVLTGLIALVA